MSEKDSSVADLERQVDASLMSQGGWFPGQTEICSAGIAGTGAAVFDVRTPLLDLLAKEPVEEGSAEAQRQQMQWMTEGAFLIIREAIGSNGRLDPVDIGLTILTWAWDIQMPPLDKMSQGQIGALAAQTRAAICERHKQKAEKHKVAVGMRAIKSQRQKPSRMVEVYAKSAAGNRNRRGSKVRESLALMG